MPSKKNEIQSFDLTPLLTPISVLLSGVMVAGSILFSLQDVDLTSSTSGVSGTSTTSSSVAVAPAADGSTPVQVVEVSYEGAEHRGSNDSKVVMVEYSDFECPFCGRHFNQVQGDLDQNWIDNGKIQYYFKDLPLDFHPEAKPAAIAAYCSGEQGKYWEMHNGIYSDQENIGTDLYNSLAQSFGLDINAFDSCLDSGRYDDKIAQFMSEASANGVQGTPGFMIGEDLGNGKMRGFLIPGAYPYTMFETILSSIEQNGVDATASACKMDPQAGLTCDL